MYLRLNKNHFRAVSACLFSLFLLTAMSPVAAQPQVPATITFAGQKVVFDRTDLRERMDRELLTIAYMHTNSTMILKRSSRYFPQVEPILKRMGIPDDLKYLMVIESNLDEKAYSPAGAAGLWQFTQSTGRMYGLEVNDNIDERYNIEKATEAACRYLKKAFEKYGDWMTVVASYNCGTNGMDNRIEKQGEKHALNLWLPEETTRYMFRLLSAKMFCEYPEAFGYHVPEKERYPYIAPAGRVEVTTEIEDLVDFAREHGITYAQLKRANLWLRGTSLHNKTQRTYFVTIPSE